MTPPEIESLEARFLCAGDFGFALDAELATVRAADAAGNSYLTLGGSIFKRRADGRRVWIRSLPENVSIADLAVDGHRNIFFTGSFRHQVDFDPGPEKEFARTGGRVSEERLRLDGWILGEAETDIFVGKLDRRGDFLWVKTVPGTGYDETATSIAIDPAGNPVISGTFSGTADFRPGSGEAILTAEGRAHDSGVARDAFIWKLDTNGKFQWVRQFDVQEPRYRRASSHELGLDGAGNIFMSGDFSGTPDFDPGPGEFRLRAGVSRTDGGESFLLKLDPAGNFVWAKRSKARIEQLAVAPDGHSYIMGPVIRATDLDPGPARVVARPRDGDNYLARLTPDGEFAWSYQTRAHVNDATIDADGNLFTTGDFSPHTDFDPGPGRRLIRPAMLPGALASTHKSFVWKLTATQDLGWVAATRGSGARAEGDSIAVGSDGSVFSSGLIFDNIDFDPGPDRFALHPVWGGWFPTLRYLWKLTD